MGVSKFASSGKFCAARAVLQCFNPNTFRAEPTLSSFQAPSLNVCSTQTLPKLVGLAQL